MLGASRGIDPSMNKRRSQIVFTLYLIAFALEGKPFRIVLLFTHKNGDFGAISVTKPSCDASIFKVESHISDRYSYFSKIHQWSIIKLKGEIAIFFEFFRTDSQGSTMPITINTWIANMYRQHKSQSVEQVIRRKPHNSINDNFHFEKEHYSLRIFPA